MSVMVRTLVRKHWVTSHRTPDARWVMRVRLTLDGEVLARRIKGPIRDMKPDLI